MSLAYCLGRFFLAARNALRLGGVRWALALGFILAAPAANAQGITLKSARVDAVEDGWQLDAEFDIQFSPKLEEAVNRGVPLYFVLDFDVTRPRWYWFDEKPVHFSQTYKISYTPLLRQYRLSVGNVYQNFTVMNHDTSSTDGLTVGGTAFLGHAGDKAYFGNFDPFYQVWFVLTTKLTGSLCRETLSPDRRTMAS